VVEFFATFSFDFKIKIYESGILGHTNRLSETAKQLCINLAFCSMNNFLVEQVKETILIKGVLRWLNLALNRQTVLTN